MVAAILNLIGIAILILLAMTWMVWELIAILTNWFPTLSEIIWNLQKMNKWVKLVVRLFLIWLFIHLYFGECAFDLCCDEVLEPVCFWR